MEGVNVITKTNSKCLSFYKSHHHTICVCTSVEYGPITAIPPTAQTQQNLRSLHIAHTQITALTQPAYSKMCPLMTVFPNELQHTQQWQQQAEKYQ